MQRVWRSRWLFVIIAIFTILRPYVSTRIKIVEIPYYNTFILIHAVKPDFAVLFPVINLIALIIVLGVILVGQKVSSIFSMTVCIAYVFSAFLQNVSLSEQYGLAISTSTLLLTLLVAGSWFYEFMKRENNFCTRPAFKRLIFLGPLMLLALWQPLDPATLLPEFRLDRFLRSGSSLTFCMMTIVSIAVMLLYYPKVNRETLRVTGVVGLLIGIGNLWLEFIFLPGMFWVGVLHLPLVALSAIALFVTHKSPSTPDLADVKLPSKESS